MNAVILPIIKEMEFSNGSDYMNVMGKTNRKTIEKYSRISPVFSPITCKSLFSRNFIQSIKDHTRI